jgi:hypothetical protein
VDSVHYPDKTNGVINMARASEGQIGLATLQILSSSPMGEASLTDVKRKIPDMIALSTKDKAQSPTRANEQIWEQQVRNLVSHRTAEGNIFAEGFAVYEEGKPLRITEAGRQHLKHKGH